ncbi:MAG: sigma-54-dependent Fis family transcriptional regulator [Acidobacteria bacterium]|nr:MAG: sigma-54-dependent Fis family transcriptional regulator [Acidobacteriota bacterium]
MTDDAVCSSPTDLACLYRLAAELLQLDDYDAMLDAIMRHALDCLRAERGFVVLRRDDQRMDFKVVRNWRRAELVNGGEPISRSIVAEVLEGGEVMLVEDALEDARYAKMESVLRQGIRSVLAAPLEVDGARVGAIYLESQSPQRLFGEAQRALFKRILELSSRALETCARRMVLEERSQMLERLIRPQPRFQEILTQDPEFLNLLDTVAQVATTDLPVLVQGETGTGKELVVRALHHNSKRAGKPLEPVNCGAISPTLVESELFGHVRGAFTDARRDKVGKIVAADGGTVFLDEVGELPNELQVKLLRTIQFGEVQPVGATHTVQVDVRFVAATNRDLEAAVAEGSFREDLYYRLNVITLELPPLRQRPDDVLPLFYHFLRRAAEIAGRPLPDVSPRLERVLASYAWPGNVRELENEAQRLLAVTPAGQPLTVDRLSKRIAQQPAVAGDADLMTLAEHERELIELRLRLAGGNRTQAAKSLGISREGLRKKLKRLGLS